MSEVLSNMMLHCQGTPGQFTSELAVSGFDVNGVQFSLFVDRRFIEGGDHVSDDRPAEILVQVEVLGRADDIVVIRLPGRTLTNGDTITVRADALEAKACQTA